jgi:glycosyltransferase involved in cell wall biosynthesis
MKIMNLMLSRGRGGIEQAFVNSAHAIHNFSDFEQLCVIDQKSTVGDQLTVTAVKIHQFADWDPIAIYQLHKLLKTFKPDLILCHGNRPLKMMLRVRSIFGLLGAKIVGFCHNFSIKYLLKADAIISVSKHILDNHLLTASYPKEYAFHIPNMIDLNDYQPIALKPRSEPIVIGTMGRFVKKKGFEDYIRAIKILIDRGLPIKAILGGGGDEEQNLKALAAELKLEGILDFIDWVHDKRSFYQQLDLFCLPSREEPFGIIALDTLAYGSPMVATRTSGPVEFLVEGENAILCNHTDPTDLANAIEKMLRLTEAELHRIVNQGFATVRGYDLATVSQQLVTVLRKLG